MIFKNPFILFFFFLRIGQASSTLLSLGKGVGRAESRSDLQDVQAGMFLPAV